MNEERLIELMKATFVTKDDLKTLATKTDLENVPTKGEFLGSVKDIRQDIADLRESDEEHKASSDALDTVLVAHPVERLDRIEQHLGLPKYAHAVSEE